MSASHHEEDPFAVAAATYGTFDRARLTLLRRAIVDPDIGPSAKLILFAIAERASEFSRSVRMSLTELRAETGLTAAQIGAGITALRFGAYLDVLPRRRSTYTLRLLRVVASREG